MTTLNPHKRQVWTANAGDSRCAIGSEAASWQQHDRAYNSSYRERLVNGELCHCQLAISGQEGAFWDRGS